MTTLTAPEAMGRREVVGDLLSSVPRVPGGVELRIEFDEESFPTTSFMDELVHQTLVGGLAARLILVHADEFIHELATTAAERYRVSDRIECL